MVLRRTTLALNTSDLKSDHEEADTQYCVILHVIHYYSEIQSYRPETHTYLSSCLQTMSKFVVQSYGCKWESVRSKSHYMAQTQLHSLCNIQSRKQLICSSSFMFSLMVVEKAKNLWLRTCREVWLSHIYIYIDVVPYAPSEDNIRVIQFGHCKRTELQPKMH